MPERLDTGPDRYDLIRRIAVGGMAEVFQATARGAHGFEKTLAIKRILPQLASDPGFEDRFIAEAKLAGQLGHANIVQIFDFGRLGGSLFIAMEHVDGVDLATLLSILRERGERLPLAAALHIAIGLTGGLGFAHQHGVIHRDVSPSNILLSRAGEVKITDFGIALAVDQGGGWPTESSVIMGKWRYMSPEQTRGARLETSSDLFSAGVVIHELVTGLKLFPGREIEEIINNINNMEVPLPSAQRPELPSALDPLVMGALARDPAARPASATAMQRALLELCFAEQIVASAHAVAEVVERVVGPSPEAGRGASERAQSRGLDALIRAQLGTRGESTATDAAAPRSDGGDGGDAEPDGDEPDGDEPDDGDRPRTRRTERMVQGERTATMLVRRGKDADGVTIWELADAPGAEPDTPSEAEVQTDADSEAAAEPKAASEAASEAEAAPTAAPAAALTVQPDRDEDDAAGAAPAAEPAAAPAANRRLVVALVALVGLAAAGAAVWLPDRGESPVPIVVSELRTPPDASSPRLGTLALASTPPGAAIAIDGEDRGQTPARIAVDADVPHAIRLTLDGYIPGVREPIVVSAGDTQTVDVELIAQTGRAMVETEPAGATVFVQGEPRGTAPVSLRERSGIALRITAKKPGYRDAERTVTLRPGDNDAIALPLDREVVRRPPPRPPPARKLGTVRIATPNTWADIYEGDRRIGVAPTQNLKLPVGPHTLVFVNPITRHRVTRQLVVKADQLVELVVDDLKP